MVASEHPEAIQGRGQLISAEVPDHEEAAGGGSIDDYNYASDEQDESGLRFPGVSTGVTEVGKKYLEGVQQAVKYSSLLYFMLKPPSYSNRYLKRIRNHRRSYSRICVILGHGQCVVMGEYPSVPILMLIPSNINTVCSIQPLWTASQLLIGI